MAHVTASTIRPGVGIDPLVLARERATTGFAHDVSTGVSGQPVDVKSDNTRMKLRARVHAVPTLLEREDQCCCTYSDHGSSTGSEREQGDPVEFRKTQALNACFEHATGPRRTTDCAKACHGDPAIGGRSRK